MAHRLDEERSRFALVMAGDIQLAVSAANACGFPAPCCGRADCGSRTHLPPMSLPRPQGEPAAEIRAASPPLLPPTPRRWSYALLERPPGCSAAGGKAEACDSN